ncbi:MAG: pilus assembly protein [Ruminiclostridium sp.]|nr:pilus assembly protein [Ruminiclostridium sp.]
MCCKTALNKKKGQTLVETALVLPIIILILMGILDFGMMFNNYLVVGNASREGARNAAVGATDMEIISIVGTVSGTLDASKITTEISPGESLRKKGDEVAVTVKYRYDFLTPLIGAFFSGNVELTGTSIMRVE